MTLEFLAVEDVLIIHAIQIERFGGSPGLRDGGLLASAVAQAQLTFDGAYVHADLVAMAGAYLFQLTSNHPFVDGNERVGLAAALVFLELNGSPVVRGTGELYELTMCVSRGECDKATTTSRLRDLVES